MAIVYPQSRRLLFPCPGQEIYRLDVAASSDSHTHSLSLSLSLIFHGFFRSSSSTPILLLFGHRFSIHTRVYAQFTSALNFIFADTWPGDLFAPYLWTSRHLLILVFVFPFFPFFFLPSVSFANKSYPASVHRSRVGNKSEPSSTMHSCIKI
jgi:hypothetical protein